MLEGLEPLYNVPSHVHFQSITSDLYKCLQAAVVLKLSTGQSYNGAFWKLTVMCCKKDLTIALLTCVFADTLRFETWVLWFLWLHLILWSAAFPHNKSVVAVFSEVERVNGIHNLASLRGIGLIRILFSCIDIITYFLVEIINNKTIV